MNRKALKTFAGMLASALGTILGTALAGAQAPAAPTLPGDWPNLGGYANRQGRNGDPLNYNSGLTNLRWLTPSTVAERATLTLDDTDVLPRTAGYDAPPFGGAFSQTAGWAAPADVNSEAGSPYLERISATGAGGFRPQPYLFTQCIPSLKGSSDATVPAAGSTLQYATWKFTPPAGTADRNYALYTYLPIGGTVVNGARVFPQRFLVYKIFFGPDANSDGLGDQSYTDVVDTESSGYGFIRLGNGGHSTQAVFPYKGGNPITIRLYNTVPRYDDGSLAITGSFAGMNNAAEVNLAASRLVYADAAQAQPRPGTYLASPTVATISRATPTVFTSDTPDLFDRVTVVRNDYVTNFANNSFSQSVAGTVIDYVANPSLWPIQTQPQEAWRYSLVASASATKTLDDDGAGADHAPEFTSATSNANHIGTDYLVTPAVVDDISGPTPVPPFDIATATYAPDLDSGAYALYTYIGGPNATDTTEIYAQSTRYYIYQGSALVDTVVVSQNRGPGWYRIGTSRYTNVRDDGNTSNSAPLKVVISNYSPTQSDATKKVFADAIRFVGAADASVASTPVHATVKIVGAPAAKVDANGKTKVVIVADESGKIHCLDAVGNGDGTTTEYWSYPSTADPSKGTQYQDPNIFNPVSGSSGIDGTPDASINPVDNAPTATMPTSFDLSTAAVATDVSGTNTADYLYIASTNGRVYCIDMAGRGDFDAASGVIGTTSRRWTYPDDYNPSAPTKPIASSDLGAFTGSVLFGGTAEGAPGPTVYVAAPQGRVYALDALGNTTSRSTTVRWRYPEATVAPIPSITMTPTLFKTTAGNGRLYAGTLRDATNDGPGRLYCLDATSGDIVWRYNGGTTQNPTDVHDKAGSLRYDAPTVFSAANGYDATSGYDLTVGNFGAFTSGMVAVPGSQLDQSKSVIGPTVAHVDTLYALNNNGYLYGFNAETGVPYVYNSGSQVYRFASNDLNVLTDANLAFTFITNYNRNGTVQELFPTLVVPGGDGRMREVFSRAEDYNAFDGYVAGGKDFQAGLTSPAAANNVLYQTDASGSLYALDEKGAAGNNLENGILPYTGVTDVIPPNDPAGAAYRQLKIRLVNKAGYAALRNVNASGTSSVPYSDATSSAAYAGPNGDPIAFEWGETAYVLVYGFPYKTSRPDANGNPVPIAPPQITLTLSVEGRTTRQIQVDARQFPIINAGDPPQIMGTGEIANGYAIVPFTFQSTGVSALPPGPGRITASITTAAIGSSGQPVDILTDTRAGHGPAINFQMANPLSVTVVSQPTNPSDTYSIGNSTIANDADNLVNGSPDVTTTTGTTLYSQLLASAGNGTHGASATARVYVTDRSLMVYVRPEGLTNVRLQRSNLERQGGETGIYKPLSATLYPNFEDKPIDRPNKSLDYPNIGREQVRATKDPNGNAENPLFTKVSLRPPLGKDNKPLTEDTTIPGPTANGRTLQATPFDLTVDIPRYQPPVNTGVLTVGPLATDDPTDLLHLRRNSVGNSALPQGYFGRAQVYVDSNDDDKRNTTTAVEAYRSFNYALGVTPQTSITVGTPTVDLGPLASGTGYSPAGPGIVGTGGNFDPWTGLWKDVYQPFVVRNDGNVNLLDLRLAKATNQTDKAKSSKTANNQVWAINSADSDPLAWLSASLLDKNHNVLFGDLWGNLDKVFAPVDQNIGASGNLVVLPKPRVTDRVATELVVNPYPRANANLGTTGTPYDVDGAGNIVGTPRTINKEERNAQNLTRPPSPPKVGVSVPLGFPSGNYSSQIRVFENGTSTSLVDDEILNLLGGEYESYSDPITLTFKVRETRMTNRTTPRTAPVIDDPASLANLPTGSPQLGSDPFKGKVSSRNASPAAMRDHNGSLLVAWPSDRASLTAGQAVNPSLIYLAGAKNDGITLAGTNAPAGNAPLWDLGRFLPTSATQWLTVGPGFPTTNYNGLFGGTVTPATIQFDSPNFPTAGDVDPLNRTASFGSTYLGFVGNAQVQTQTGRLVVSRVFLSQVSYGSSLSQGTPIAVPGDPQTAKGKPSVLQLSGGALVFYAETSAGQSGITATRLLSDGTFANPVALDFGEGFSSVFSPSASARLYTGGDATLNNANRAVVDLSFAGKLRGRPNAEVYLGRMRLDRNSKSLVDAAGNSVEAKGAGSPFVLLPQQSNERLVNEGGGNFRARGVLWNRQAGVGLYQTLNGALTSVFVGTPTVDAESGLIAYDSRLGGKVYLDPELGTVKFAGAVPGRNAELRLTYTPTFLRVTPGGTAGYSSINGLWDGRYVGETGSYVDTMGNTVTYYPYWFRSNGSLAVLGDNPRNDRYVFAYGRGAAGGGVTARPYSTTMRLGVRLPTRIATDANGNVVNVQVSGNTKPYQVDPANGRIYFMAEDEDRPIRITYTGVDETTNANVSYNVPTLNTDPPLTVSFILERDEAPLPVDEAANDSALSAFIDPFSFPSTSTVNNGRPPLVWLFYTSTRAGQPDVYFQTVAPRFLPFAK